MTLGYSVDQNTVNNRAGQLVAQLWSTLRDLNEFNAWLNDAAHTDAFLIGLGFTQAEVTALRAGISDLGSANGLYGVAHGTKTQASVNDFFFNAKKLTGTTWAG